jgi:maleate isomerase
MYGWRARIGYTSPPSATEVFPYEFYRIVPDGVTLVVHTLPLTDKSGDEVDRSYDASERAAKVMARAGIDIMVFGGVPILASRGFATAEQMVRETERAIGKPVITSASAQKDALAAVGARKVGVVQPYDDSHGERFLGYVREFGCEPTGWASVNASFIELGAVDEERVLAAGRQVMRDFPDSDTIHIPCPHFATANVIEPLEREFGVNVVTSLQSIVWNALRRVGIDDRIDGYGRLLAEF